MRFIRSRLFDDTLVALKESDPDLFSEVAADIQYLIELRRDAELPQVRFGLKESRHPDVVGEVRSHLPGEQAFIRTLFGMTMDESVVTFAIIGDKNTPDGEQGNASYVKAVPILDALWDQLLEDGTV